MLFSWDNRNGKGPWGSSGGNRNGGNKNQPDMDDVIRQAQDKLGRMMGGGGGGYGRPGDGDGMGGKSWGLIGLVIGAAWLASGFYMVAPAEVGVVKTFGKFSRMTGPGPNYHLPWPVEAVLKPNVLQENMIQVGFRGMGATSPFARYDNSSQSAIRDIPEESLMLTGDENIVDLDFTVRWQIKDPEQFLFRVANPQSALFSLAESAMREEVGKRAIDEVLTEKREDIQVSVRKNIQRLADLYELGIQINGVELQQVNPPTQVIDAFRDVQAARADAETMRNEAQGYANDRIPRARGEVAKIIQAAEAYREAKVSEAQGKAARFTSQLSEYRNSKDVTAERMYLETMEEVLGSARTVVMGKDSGKSILPYLPLDTDRKQPVKGR
ncbi:MAG: FtsH protease activity modulator HflK [Proteobacteria bacterium]|nr:FtsH protease activity modulator HflK [Pseudomonadota bacterium]